MTGICAICAADGDVHRESLDGRDVNVCARCADEHPRAGGYSFSARSRAPSLGPSSLLNEHRTTREARS